MKPARAALPVLLALALGWMAAAGADDKPVRWDGSRVSPVHKIPLKDELDQEIVPSESYPLPFSARFTCAPCHIYDVVRTGLHFSAGRTSAPAGRPGEPWIWADEGTGTMIPLSFRKWKGVWDPRAVGLTDWEFTRLFARHLAGGGISEPRDEEVTPDSRWNVSGRLEANCMGCHNASPRQDPSEWARQVMRENFRWAATAASGLGEVGGMASRLPATWDLFDGPNPDDKEWAVVPTVRYDPALFDSRHNAFLDIAYKPDDGRCLACHGSSPAGSAKHEFDDDVHGASGLKCVSCHRNGIAHDMVRGYEGETRYDQAADSLRLTCAGCHLGKDAEKGGKGYSGRLGAPFPKHNGFPRVHFERLSCTFCHSGPLPAGTPARVRTARANRLGVFGIARWATDLPAIFEPVYVRGEDGKLGPNRITWPAFWADTKSGKAVPIKPDEVRAAAGDILDPAGSIVRILAAFYDIPDLGGTPLAIMAGRAFEMNADAGLDASNDPGDLAADGIVWAVRKEGGILPLVPGIDPDAAEADTDAEARLQQILVALGTVPGAPGRPAFAVKKAVYVVTNGLLEKREARETQAAPGLVWLKDAKIFPLVADSARRAVLTLAGTDQTLTEEQVSAVLAKLGKDHAYISGGRLFRMSAKGRLEARKDAAAEPVLWPLAHEVRPARMSLGANGCTDCHSAGSSLLFAAVKGYGPLRTSRVDERSRSSFMGIGRPYHFLFGLSFAARPLLKWVLFVTAVAAGALLFLAVMIWLGRFSGLVGKRS